MEAIYCKNKKSGLHDNTYTVLDAADLSRKHIKYRIDRYGNGPYSSSFVLHQLICESIAKFVCPF